MRKEIPIHSYPLWNGFQEAYEGLWKEPLLVVDLRGNQGGDDSRGIDLAKFLYGGAPPMLAEERTMRRTPEAIALQLNRFILMRGAMVLPPSEVRVNCRPFGAPERLDGRKP